MKSKNLLIFFLILSFGALNAQTRIMGKPLKFDRPEDYENESDMKDFVNSRDRQSKEIAWIVISDRDDNPTYEKPDLNSSVVENIPFKDYFYVVDEKDEWIHIVKARTSGLKITKLTKDYGWVPKDKMLLWTAGMVDHNTKIHKKAFLLNKVQDIERILREDSKDFAQIYSGPKTNKIAEKKTIYEFYFVYKRENNRYLLGKESIISSSRIESVLIGWVDRVKAADWNTRIALEPNFDVAAFEERKANSDLRVIGFTDLGGANGYAQIGKIVDEKKAWDNDPIKIEKNKLANSDPKRFKGSVVRFPMLQNYPDAYMSGAIGEIQTKSMQDVVKSKISKISEINYSAMSEGVKQGSAVRDNYNIFFVIEGTRQLGKYKQAVLNVMDNLEREFSDEVNIRYGASVFRDIPEEQADKLFEMQPLVNDKKKVIDFINQAQFDQWYDNDDWTALYYAMNETLVKGGFADDNTNIIFLIGNNADYKFDRVRKNLVEENGDKTYVSPELILDNLATLNAHLISIQCVNSGSRASNRYPMMSASFIVEASKKQHVAYSGITEYFPGTTVVNPSMGDMDEGKIVKMTGGPNVGRILKPVRNSEISQTELQDFMVESINEVKEQVEKTQAEMKKIMEGEAVDLEQSSGAWEPAIAREVYRLIQKRQKDQSFTDDDLKKIIDEKYHLYREVYLAKKIKGAKYPTMSYVLFMPREDLRDYIRVLKQLAIANDGTPDKKRETLFLTFTELLKQFTGNSEMSRRDIEKTSADELRAIMQGIKDEGLQIGDSMDFKIGSILSPKQMDEDQLDKIIDNILKKLDGLEGIYKLGDRYDFSYTTPDNTYFWVPVEYAL